MDQQQKQPQGSIDKSPSGDYPQRPIVLSPPPLDSTSFNAVDALPTGHANRQQSVGYNLQHEFETLTANLDLDLTSPSRSITQSAPPPQQSVDAQLQQEPKQLLSSGSSAQSSKPALVAPSASRYEPRLRSELLGKTASSLLGETSAGGLSPAQQFTSLNPQLDSLLNKSSSNLVGSPSAGNSFLSGHLAGIPNRPQSVNDFSSIFKRHEQQQQQHQQFFSAPQTSNQSNFYLDLIVFCNWIENLSPQDNITMIDYLCANLPLDILLTFQSKLDLHLQGGAGAGTGVGAGAGAGAGAGIGVGGSHYQQNQQTHLLPQFSMSPYNQYNQDLYSEMDQLNINDDRSKPKQPSALRTSQYANLVDKPLRPKSADPFVNNAKYASSPSQQQHMHQGPIDRAKSPTSHLYEKTNFLQLAAANSNSSTPPVNGNGMTSYYNQYMSTPLGQSNSPGNTNQGKDIMDLKLGALATINSRVALDSNRKHPHASNWNQNQLGQQQSQQHNVSRSHAMNYEDSINRTLNSSSVPANMHKTTYNSNSNNNNNVNNNSNTTNSNNNNQSKSHKKKGHSPTSATQMQHNNSSTVSTNTSSGTSSMPIEVSSLELLNNIPAWLKLLRLHKYTEFLKDIPWRDLIELDNDQLEAKGVAALGARRKLLKAFDVVKNNPPQ
ncbi:MAG: hypothetical protein M5F18_04520 [Asgard group archaeon]|nr:hypothetical protein [Asgard group archaeon]